MNLKVISKIATGLMGKGKLSSRLIKSGEYNVLKSSNPLKAERFIHNGQKLANGPKTFMRQLKHSGFDKSEYKQYVKKWEKNPDFLTKMSAELTEIPAAELKFVKNREYILKEMDCLAKQTETMPEILYDTKGYGKFLSTNITGNGRISTSTVLKNGVYDFGTVSNMQKVASKYCDGYYLSYIPNIVKNSAVPHSEVTKIFENCLRLTEKGSNNTMVSRHFTNILKATEGSADGAAEYLENIISKTNGKITYDPEVLDMIVSNGRRVNYTDWMVDFIAQSGEKSPEAIAGIKFLQNEHQAQTLLKWASKQKYINLEHDFEPFVKEGLLNNKYQCELFNYLDDIKPVNPALGGRFTEHRFSDIAKAKILQHVKSETDVKLVKAAIEQRGLVGDDLYKPFAIEQFLKQNNETKLKILKNFQNRNVKTIPVAQVNRQQYNVGRLRQANLKSLFQKDVLVYSENLPKSELLSKLKSGEVVQIGSKLHVFDGAELSELNISAETFKRLFNSNIAGISQRGIGDCEFLAVLDQLLKTPKGRAHIFKMFSENHETKDICVQLYSSDKIFKFSKGIVNQGESAFAPSGVQMLEQAFLTEHSGKLINAEKIIDINSIAPEIWNKEHGISAYKACQKLLPEGSYKINGIHSRIGNAYDVNNYAKLEAELSKINQEKNSIAVLSTWADLTIHPDIPLVRMHAHGLAGIDKYGHLFIENPHYANIRQYAELYNTLNTQYIEEIKLIELI